MRDLLPFRFKVIGMFLVVCGAVLSVFYFVNGFRISMPVLAVFSYYLEAKVFAVFKTNITEELIMLLLVVGFGMMVYSKEKDEKPFLRVVRINAAMQTIKWYVLWVLFTILFVFGNGFIAVLILNTVLPFIVYLVLFQTKKRKVIQRKRLKGVQRRILKPPTN